IVRAGLLIAEETAQAGVVLCLAARHRRAGPQGTVPGRGAPPKGPRGRGNLAGGGFRQRAGVSVGGSHRRPARILSSGDTHAVLRGALLSGCGHTPRDAAGHRHQNAIASLRPAAPGAPGPGKRGNNSQTHVTNMNCAECRENLVACLEGLLEAEQSRQCQAHLESCKACRAEYAGITRLQERLVARGRAAAEVSLVEPVMRVVRQRQIEPERTTLMSLLFKSRWGFGLGAAASAAAVIVIIALAAPKAQAKAADVMARGARAIANITSIHLRGQLRTLPADNFSYIDADSDFYPIELWKQFTPELKWRVEKPGRIVVMDGQQTLHYIKSAKVAVKLPQPSTSAFDTDWLHRI